jgi:type IV secretory pathway VirB3-like protein
MVVGGDTVAMAYIIVIQDAMIISHNHHWVKRCVSVNINKNFGSNLAELGRKF